MSETHISNLGLWRNGERLIPCRYASQYNCRRLLNLGNMSGTDNSSLPGDQLAGAIRTASAMRGGTLVIGDSINNPEWVCPDHYHICYHCGAGRTGTSQEMIDAEWFPLDNNQWLCHSCHDENYTHTCINCNNSETGTAQDMLDAGWRRDWNGNGDWSCEECLFERGIITPSVSPSPSPSHSPSHSPSYYPSPSLSPSSSAPSTPERSGSERSDHPSLREIRRRRRRERARSPTVEDENLADQLSLSPSFIQERREARDASNQRLLQRLGLTSDRNSNSEDEEQNLPRYMTRLQIRNAENERIVREQEERDAAQEERDLIQYKLEQRAALLTKIQTAKQQPINLRLADDTKTIYDMYQLEDVTIANILKDKDEDGDIIPLDELNIVFQQDKEPFNAIAVTKKTLEDMVYNPSYLNQTKYECYLLSEALAFDENNLVFDQGNPNDRHNYTFINSRALGLVAGMFIRSQLKEIVDNLNNQRNAPRYFMYHITNMTVAPIIAADKVGWKTPPSSWTHYELPQWERNFSEAHTETGSMVSADHCQSLDYNYIVAIQPVRNLRKRKNVDYSSNNNKKKTKKGGKKNRRKKKTHKRKRKRKTRKKRHKNKKKTKKRKN